MNKYNNNNNNHSIAKERKGVENFSTFLFFFIFVRIIIFEIYKISPIYSFESKREKAQVENIIKILSLSLSLSSIAIISSTREYMLTDDQYDDDESRERKRKYAKRFRERKENLIAKETSEKYEFFIFMDK